MASKSQGTWQGTWYVSFELPRRKRAHVRATETFPNEREAKEFVASRCAWVSTTDRWDRLGGLEDRNKSAQIQAGADEPTI